MMQWNPFAASAERAVQKIKIERWKAAGRRKGTYLSPRCPQWLYQQAHPQTVLWLRAEASIRTVGG